MIVRNVGGLAVAMLGLCVEPFELIHCDSAPALRVGDVGVTLSVGWISSPPQGLIESLHGSPSSIRWRRSAFAMMIASRPASRHRRDLCDRFCVPSSMI